MNWDQVQGSWNQVKGKAKQMWGDLTDDELDTIAGKRDELVGRLHQVWHQQGRPLKDRHPRGLVTSARCARAA